MEISGLISGWAGTSFEFRGRAGQGYSLPLISLDQSTVIYSCKRQNRAEARLYIYYRIFRVGLYRIRVELYLARFVELSGKSYLRNY